MGTIPSALRIEVVSLPSAEKMAVEETNTPYEWQDIQDYPYHIPGTPEWVDCPLERVPRVCLPHNAGTLCV